MYKIDDLITNGRPIDKIILIIILEQLIQLLLILFNN